MRRLAALLVLGALGCGPSPLTLRYEFDPEDVPGSAVATLETHIAPTLPQRFVATMDERPLETGVRYAVACPDAGVADCLPEMVVVHERALGFSFSDDFVLRFVADGDRAPSRVVVSAIARDADGATLARAPQVESAFADTTIEVVLHARERCGAALCQPTEACCAGRCVDPTRDPSACGGCGTQCGATEICSDGACRCGAEPGCRGDQTCCGGDHCADTMGDPQSCGGCGIACGAGESCVGGACACGPGAACAAGERCCGSDGPCVAATAQCPCGGTTCDVGVTCCAGACINLASDAKNCGQCARDCSDKGLGCTMGACSCGAQSCGADCCGGSACVDLQLDHNNCGACGVACAGNETCAAGKCVCGGSPDCGAGAFCCGTTTKACQAQDTQDCGGCGIACATNEVCSAGTCGCPANVAGKHCASGTCCPSGCHDLMSDSSNCGACGHACTGTGMTCVGGVCTQTSCATDCSAKGETCAGTACVCHGAPDCAAGKTCCNDGCFDLTMEPTHCGACGVACGTKETCTGSACHCGGGAACSNGLVCDGATCLLPPGGACTQSSQCGSGSCSEDGHCCAGACTGPCHTCASGVCMAAAAGAPDPTHKCMANGNECGPTGRCASGGLCEFPDESTPCCASMYELGTCADGSCVAEGLYCSGPCGNGSCF